MASCDTCTFFDPIDGSTGMCRLEPPKVIDVINRNRNDERETKPFTAWPVVRNKDWCGEHTSRQGE